ncbi:MAG: hypothetical protein ACT4QA_21910 [Panacagrimonas sp.]
MQRIGRMSHRLPPNSRSLGSASRSRRSGPRSAADRALERRLTAEFWRYTLDVPEDAFPSFLESLYFEPLTGDDAP